MTDTITRVNGTPAGREPGSEEETIHQCSFYEFSYDVTDNLNFGACNLLEVTVKKDSDNASVNEAERLADYWLFGGIFRPVYLEVRPVQNIDRVAVDAKADGQITVDAYLSGIDIASTVAARVTDMNDVALGSEFTQSVASGATSAVLSAAFPSREPLRFHQSEPVLVQLAARLVPRSG